MIYWMVSLALTAAGLLTGAQVGPLLGLLFGSDVRRRDRDNRVEEG